MRCGAGPSFIPRSVECDHNRSKLDVCVFVCVCDVSRACFLAVLSAAVRVLCARCSALLWCFARPVLS